MSAMIRSDFITMKRYLGQLLAVCLVVVVAITAMTQSLVSGVAVFASTVPLMYLFSISAYDEMNGWERFRLTLPISRRQVAFGRYGSFLLVTASCAAVAVLLGLVVEGVLGLLPANAVVAGLSPAENPPRIIVDAALLAFSVILPTAALTLPLVMRFGMTKATRLLPAAIVMLLSLGIWLLGNSGLFDQGLPFFTAIEDDSSQGLALCIAAGAVALGLYGASALVAARLYEQRQF